MKKSELRQMIREMLQEELSKVSNKTLQQWNQFKGSNTKNHLVSTSASLQAPVRFAVAKTRTPKAGLDHFYFDDGGCFYTAPFRFLQSGRDLFDTVQEATTFAKEVLKDNYYDEAYVVKVINPTTFKYHSTVSKYTN